MVEFFEQFEVRAAKRQALLDAGEQPYPVVTVDTTSLSEIYTQYGARLDPNEITEHEVTVTGRLTSLRNLGRLSFAVIQGSLTKAVEGLQLILFRQDLGEERYAAWKAQVDLGDIIQATGFIGRSSTGELSVFVRTWSFRAKALRPLPNQHVELNEETRVRQPYLNLLVNPTARQHAILRPAVIQTIRQTLSGLNYIEVETPMLHTIQGGATARPFVTHSHALDEDLYLRIAPELFLKRAIVGGFERVFEINRNFRNEGMDATHTPEFTMLEAYQVNADYNVMANLVEQLFHTLGARLADMAAVENYVTPLQDTFAGASWDRISLYTSLGEHLGEDITPATDLAHLTELATVHNLEVKHPTTGKLVEELWEHLVKPTLTRPTFVFDFPVDTSPLVAAHRDLPGVVEKWDLYIQGMEIATGYSELVDPVIQRARLTEQARLAGAGDDEAMRLDEAFLTALEYGMPPTGGIGLGIDRLLMLLTGGNVRETVLFPIVR